MLSSSLSRRSFLALGGASAIATLPLPSFALTTSQAEGLVTSAVAEINRIISSGASVGSMINSFGGVFNRYADTAYVAAFALGNSGRSASNAQRSAFRRAFVGYVAEKYGRRFNEFAGGQIVVQGSRAVDNYVEVQTIADLPGQSPFRVDFHVSDRTGQPLFFNLIVEGV
ncbi:MAG: ABC transporter substrate-binding protein, partial [Pseudomonadota bacterium]